MTEHPFSLRPRGLRPWLLWLAGLFILVAACAAPATSTTPPAASMASPAASTASPATSTAPAVSARLQVLATTTILGDVVKNVAGEAADVRTLLPVNADPHGFQPTPADVVLISQADLVFVNGLGLEELLLPLLAGALPAHKIVAVSEGIEPIVAHAAEDAHEEAAEHDHAEGIDPHTWTDPTHVILWTQVIAAALAAADPAQAERYQANARAYEQTLRDLDAWVQEQVAQVPPAQRLLVSEHAVFAYFARRYGFTQVGTVIPGFSALAEPSAQDLAAVEDAIRQVGVRAIFVGNTVNPRLAERVAADTGIRVIPVYSGSLSAADGPASTYVAYIRYNTHAFVAGMN